MKLVETIGLTELTEMSKKMFDELVKAVVDIEMRLVVVDAGLHTDEELYLLGRGSNQSDLWGINLYPEHYGSDSFVEFDSMINIRPAQGNRSRSVESIEIQKLIREIIDEVVYE
ncbi:MAG: DUF5674 family protein [Coriobacteriia bacterium]|nr:DUF5674 family protein [Coriobacteriia bacterium]